MGSSRTLNSARNAFINLCAKVLALLCGFVIRTVFLKYLGNQYTGVSTLFTDILNVLSFTELGIGTAISFAFYKPIAENDDYRVAQLMKLCRYIYTIISLSVFVLGMAFIPFLGYFVKDVPDIKEDITLIYVLYVVKTALSYLLVYKSTLIIAKQKRFIVTAVESICQTVKTAADVVLLMTTKNFMVYLYLEIICTLVTNLIISTLANREMKKGKQYSEVNIDKSDFKPLFKDVKDVFIYKVSGIVLNSTDSLIISRVISTATVAFMSNYNLIFNAINAVVYQIINAMTASVGNLGAQSSTKEQKNVFYTINFLVYIFTGVVCCGLWLCVNSFVEILWGGSYVLSDGITALLCINLFVVNMHLTVDMFRNANGVFHKGRMRPLATAVINLVVSIVAAKYMGLFGVLLGTVVSRVSTQLWYDSKLIFNVVFKESVKTYYLKYLVFSCCTFACCFLGSLVLKCFSANVYLRFAAGFCFAILINAALILLIFRKTDEYKSAVRYLLLVIKRR